MQGIQQLNDIVSLKESSNLMEFIDAQPWSGRGIPPNPGKSLLSHLLELLRRTQQYGYLFSFKTRQIESDLGPLPLIFDAIIERLQPFFDSPIDYVTVNEFEPGQGIMPHVDSLVLDSFNLKLFGPVVVSLSLLSPCIMTLSKKGEPDIQLLLEPRSILALSQDKRYEYTHAISKERRECIQGREIERGRRVSIVFRTLARKVRKNEIDEDQNRQSGTACH